MTAAIDETGNTYGRLRVLSRAPSHRGKVMWRCLCECGSEAIIQGMRLRVGKTRSCGCFQREAASARSSKHGATRRVGRWPEWGVWRQMLNRCYRPQTVSFERYGGRGISVCDRWRFGEGDRTGFECFVADVGRRPAKGLSIDRIDNDGNYEPGNVRWATSKQQAANRRRPAHWRQNNANMESAA
jgi:hypothetical protein